MIRTVDGNKSLILSKGSNAWSSANVLLPEDIKVNDILRLEYDFKYEYVHRQGVPVGPNLNSAFVGPSNEPYYRIDLYNIFDGQFTTGSREEYYLISVQNNPLRGEGWKRVTLEIKVDEDFLKECNTLRFLVNSNAAENFNLYIDNVELYILRDKLQDEEPIDEVPIEEPIDEEPNNQDPDINKNNDGNDNNYKLWLILCSSLIAILGVGGLIYLLKRKN